VFDSIIDRSDPSRSLKSNLIKGVNKDYLSLLVSNLIKGLPLRARKTDLADSTIRWIVEYMKHKMKISVSVFQDSKDLSLRTEE
jgi:hypothetical protein